MSSAEPSSLSTEVILERTPVSDTEEHVVSELQHSRLDGSVRYTTVSDTEELDFRVEPNTTTIPKECHEKMLGTVDKIFEAVGLPQLTRTAKVLSIGAALVWLMIGFVWFIQGFVDSDAQAPFAFVWAAILLGGTLLVILGIDAIIRRLR